jgi:hypothetical protein
MERAIYVLAVGILASPVSGLQIGVCCKLSKPEHISLSLQNICGSFMKISDVIGEKKTCAHSRARTIQNPITRYEGKPSRHEIFTKRSFMATKSFAKSKVAIIALFGIIMLVPKCAFASTASAAGGVITEQRIWALLMAAAAFGSWSEERTAIGALISGCMVTFFTAMALSTVGLLPTLSSTPAYQAVSNAITVSF